MASVRRTRLASAAGAAVILLCGLSLSGALDPLDPLGKIMVRWDVVTWTPDGYVALVTMSNTQKYRHIEEPGWTLGWHWAKAEVIWSMVGAQAVQQGDCSRFYTSLLPHSCERDPQIVDLMLDVPFNSRIGNCCRGGVVSSYAQDPQNSVAAFQISVGRSGNSNTSVALPENFTLAAPGPGYTCGAARLQTPTTFPTADGRRFSQALMTWDVTCTYTQKLAPTCCVSFSRFHYDTKVVPCQTCACACKQNTTCVDPNQPKAFSAPTNAEGLLCTHDMCPVEIRWHVAADYAEYWKVTITVTNKNLLMNYTHWNVVAQHPNFDNLYDLPTFLYKDISNDTGMFYGIHFLNDILGSGQYIQGDILFKKDNRFTFKHGWAFPRKVYFNGDGCVLPKPEDYLP